MNHQIGLLAAASVAILGTILLSKILRSRRAKVPKAWRYIGQVSELFCYPLKSCGVVRLSEMNCVPLGPQSGSLQDRTFAVMDSSTRKSVSARQYPKMVLITPHIEDGLLILSAPGVQSLKVDLNEVVQRADKSKALIWFIPTDILDCGDEAARWLSRHIMGTEEGIRLVFYPYETATRKVQEHERNRIWPDMENEHAGAMTYEASYMILNEASVTDLNGRLEGKRVSSLWFRPNIVFTGDLPAYSEDSVRWMKIGEKAVFKYQKPCTRCLFTTINPETAERDPRMEPLKTLKTYRIDPKGEPDPVMGNYFGVVRLDSIKIGDPVYIGEE